MTLGAVAYVDGKPTISATCDKCGKSTSMPCKTDTPGQATKKLVAQGWRSAGGKHVCPACCSIERGEKNVNLKVVEPQPRTATPPEMRRIFAALEEAYDAAEGRYFAGMTDETVAAGLGMQLAWVENVRREFFGEAGDNDDMAGLALRVEALAKEVETATAAALDAATKLEAHGQTLKAMRDELAAIRKAVGRRLPK